MFSFPRFCFSFFFGQMRRFFVELCLQGEKGKIKREKKTYLFFSNSSSRACFSLSILSILIHDEEETKTFHCLIINPCSFFSEEKTLTFNFHIYIHSHVISYNQLHSCMHNRGCITSHFSFRCLYSSLTNGLLNSIISARVSKSIAASSSSRTVWVII